MARYYGGVKGTRGEATRLGDLRSGLDVFAASYQGKVTVRLYARGDVDWAEVSLEPHLGAGIRKTLYHGPVGGTPVAPEARHLTVGVEA